jgi:cyclopropane fatty-acyl-phospholipid synthase-like methyltransferase
MGDVRWTRERLVHAASMLRFGRNPAATVYRSIGTDFFLAISPGWLNLGLWEGDGSDPSEAGIAPRRLVERLAADLPRGGRILDVGNGLGVQDRVIAEVTGARRLTAVNITLSQLRAGRPALHAAGAHAVNADACRLPFRAGSFDGLISVEAAFHFESRRRFFQQAAVVLRPGGTLTMSDVATMRMPRTPRELIAGLFQLRVWGLRRSAAMSVEQIVTEAERAGFVDVRTELVGGRVIAPALRFVRRRLDEAGAPSSMSFAARIAVSQAERLWRNGLLDYLLLRATRGG